DSRSYEVILNLVSCSYSQWFSPNKFFEKNILDKYDSKTWEQALNFDRWSLKSDSLAQYPWLAVRLGVGVILLTQDKKVVVPMRSEAPSEGQPNTYSCSIGETVFGVDKVQEVAHLLDMKPSGSELVAPSPVATVKRALEKELGLIANDD